MLENTDDVINLTREIHNEHYADKEFYDKYVVEYYIKKINYYKGGAWKGVFFKDQLIAQMLASIENHSVILKLTMIKEEFRNLGIMKFLSVSMIKEIDEYKETDFRTIFAFVNPARSSQVRPDAVVWRRLEWRTHRLLGLGGRRDERKGAEAPEQPRSSVRLSVPRADSGVSRG